jgi:hypothetical protein
MLALYRKLASPTTPPPPCRPAPQKRSFLASSRYISSCSMCSVPATSRFLLLALLLFPVALSLLPNVSSAHPPIASARSDHRSPQLLGLWNYTAANVIPIATASTLYLRTAHARAGRLLGRLLRNQILPFLQAVGCSSGASPSPRFRLNSSSSSSSCSNICTTLTP